MFRPSPVTLIAAVTFALIVIRAATTVDPYWDTLAYHWPYAARAAGVCDRDCFLMPLGLEARYDGFPLLLHTAQGMLWRLTGTPAMGDLINIAMLVALCAYLRYRFAVPLAWSWLAFLAIPEIQIELTSGYIDGAVNAMASVGLMVVVRMLVLPNADQRADIVIALAGLGIAAGSKFQMIPIALLAWLAIIVLAVRNPASIGLKRRGATLVLLSIAGIVVLLPKLALNAMHFGNPLYPLEYVIGPIHWTGPETPRQMNSISDFWADWPGPVRWLASVLEFNAFGGRPLPWTIGQGDVPQSNPAFRMGGYFGVYVMGAVALVVWAARTTPSVRRAAWLVAVISIVCACLPLSHDLRYYLFWMLTLVGVVLAIIHAPAFASADQPAQRRSGHALILIAATAVVLITGGAYLQTDGLALPDLVHESDATIARLPDGATLCIRNKYRRAFLYAPIFHPGRHYRVHLLEADEPDPACTSRVTLAP